MLRIIFASVVCLPAVLYYLWKADYIERHDTSYTEEDRYRYARRMVRVMMWGGRIRTEVYGAERLPQDGGYVMYANHQGKYDALGVVYAHEAPCTVVIDEQRSHLFLTDQFVSLLKGARLDRTNRKSQVKTVLAIIEEVKAGRRYLIFPEGGYYHNRNEVQEFLPGAFKCAMKSQSPIVPVVLIDSYKPFGVNSIRRVTTQVHFLEPLYYEDYKDMNSIRIAQLVREQIVAEIAKYT